MKYEKIQKRCIPTRVIIGILGCMGSCLLYVLRSNLSVAIIAMVDEIEVLEENNQTLDNDLCYDITNVNKTNSYSEHKGTFDWSQSVQGVILGSYFYGYAMTQFCGTFADKFGAKWMIGLGVFIPAICNALIPVLAQIHYNYVVVMRVLMGAFHGVIYSSLFALISKWFPQSEKNLALTGFVFSSNFGGVLTMPLAGYLCEIDFMNGWPTVFYFTSIIHLFWFIFWIYFVSNTPEEHRSISESELEYIKSGNKNSRNIRNLTTPWVSILTSRAVWASIVTKMCASFGYYLLCTKLPTFLDTIFGLAIHTNSWFNSLMYAVLCCSNLIGGPLSTWVRSKGWFSQTRNRKNFQSFALFSCSLCLLSIPMVECNSQAVIALFLLGMFVFGSLTGGELAVVPEYAPNYSGTVFGVTNTLASTTGFMGPLFVGLLLDNGDGSGIRHQWNIVWYISAAVYAFGGLIFELLGTAEPQHWAIVPFADEYQSEALNIKTMRRV